jgi:hypothetical protein
VVVPPTIVDGRIDRQTEDSRRNKQNTWRMQCPEVLSLSENELNCRSVCRVAKSFQTEKESKRESKGFFFALSNIHLQKRGARKTPEQMDEDACSQITRVCQSELMTGRHACMHACIPCPQKYMHR